MKKVRTVIEPPESISLQLRELWTYRELFYFFTWRDIKVKYKQTYLGLAWAVIQPVGLLLLFTFVFAPHFTPRNTSVDYKLFVLSGLILWNLFNSATAHAAESIVVQSNIIKKIYFPRLVIIGSALLTALFDFFIQLALLLLACIFFKQHLFLITLLAFPAAILLVMLAAFGAGSLLASLNVKFRDFRYALPFLLQFMFFASQVVYALSDVENLTARNALAFNPMNAAIELFRGGLTNQFNWRVIATGAGMAIFLAVGGLFYFRKTEVYFADIA